MQSVDFGVRVHRRNTPIASHVINFFIGICAARATDQECGGSNSKVNWKFPADAGQVEAVQQILFQVTISSVTDRFMHTLSQVGL